MHKALFIVCSALWAEVLVMWRGVRRPGEAIGPGGQTGRRVRGGLRDLFCVVNSYQKLAG